MLDIIHCLRYILGMCENDFQSEMRIWKNYENENFLYKTNFAQCTEVYNLSLLILDSFSMKNVHKSLYLKKIHFWGHVLFQHMLNMKTVNTNFMSFLTMLNKECKKINKQCMNILQWYQNCWYWKKKNYVNYGKTYILGT
jgi:hypothetical protein